VLLAYLARKTGRPLRWTETRSENLVAMHHGRAQRIDFEIGGKRDGTVEALRWRILQDAGAYPGLGAFLPNLTAMMASGVYRIPNIEIEVTAVVTNTTPTGPVRGSGRPEATQALERAMDMFAADLSMDPAEVRRRNFIPKDAFPYQTASGAHYDIGDYERALDLALEQAGYASCAPSKLRAATTAPISSSASGSACTWRSPTGSARPSSDPSRSPATARPSLKTGSLSQGQGHETTFAMIASERLGIPIEKITVLRGDNRRGCAWNRHVRFEVDPDRRRRRRTGV